MAEKTKAAGCGARCAPYLAMALLALACAAARAHEIHLTVQVEGARIFGQVYESPEEPVAGARVRLIDAAGAAVAAAASDGSGRFALVAPARADYVVECTTDDGHRAERAVPAAALPDTASPDIAGPAAGGVEQALARQLAPVFERLGAIERASRFRDALGGLGYIAGIAGLYAWLQARRGRD